MSRISSPWSLPQYDGMSPQKLQGFLSSSTMLDGLAERKRLILVLEPQETGATTVLRPRTEVVEEAVLGGRTIYLGTVPHMDLIRRCRTDLKYVFAERHLLLLHRARGVTAEERDRVVITVERDCWR